MKTTKSWKWAVGLLTLWILAGCIGDIPALPAAPSVSLAGASGDYTIEYVAGECPYTGYEEVMTCGYLRVPQDRANPDALTLELAVAVLHSSAQEPALDPILYLEGGPGDSALIDPDYWLDLPLLQERDLILFDQRGTGYSWPNLSCPEEDAADSEDESAQMAAVAACRDRLLEMGVDLSAYHSAASAADIEDLRRVLDIEQWNLIGISYGTRLALTVMRDFPAGVRSVVLDSVYPPNVDAPGTEAVNSADAILALLIGCEEDGPCAQAFPDLTDRFFALLDAWADEPAEVDADLFMTDQDLLNLLVDLLYDTEAIPALPLLIYNASEGDYDLLLEWYGEEESGAARRNTPQQGEEDLPEDSQGMFYSVECHERAVFSTPEQAAQKAKDLDPALAIPLLEQTQTFFETCDLWQAGAAPALENQAVVSSIPTLLLAGAYDPVTPPAWARLAGETLANSYYVELPRAGHALLAVNPCMTGMVNAFITAPQSAPDTGCVAESVLAFEVE